MQKTCGRIVLEFSTDLDARDLLERFDEIVVRSASMKIKNMSSEEAHLVVDHHEIITLFDSEDEQVV